MSMDFKYITQIKITLWCAIFAVLKKISEVKRLTSK